MTIPYVQDYSLTLNKFLEHAARWRPEAGVITARGNGETSRTGYGELLERSRSFSAGLLALRIRPGDRVATLAWNTQEHVEAWYGISGIGAVIHTLNPRLSVDTLGAMVRLAECRLLVVAANLASIAVELVRIAPSIERIIVIDDPVEVRDLAASVPVSLYASVCLDEDVAWGDFDETSPAGLCFTSGTTASSWQRMAPWGGQRMDRASALAAVPDGVNQTSRSVSKVLHRASRAAAVHGSAP